MWYGTYELKVTVMSCHGHLCQNPRILRSIHFFVINSNISVNLSTSKIFNPHTWKSLCFTNFSFYPWVKSFNLVYILLFNNTLMKNLFVNLVTKYEKISYIIISSNFTPNIRLKLIISLFTLCIRKVKTMLISLKYHVYLFKMPIPFQFFPFKIKVFW